jgi:two-component system LytT family response regulator
LEPRHDGGLLLSGERLAMSVPAHESEPSILRAVVVDHEPQSRQNLRKLLEMEPGVRVVEECKNADEAIAAVHTYRPELLLLNISMPNGDGLKVLNCLQPASSPVVICTTAQDKSAVKAFETNAADYLLKPFDQERLHDAILKARRGLLASRNEDVNQRLMQLIRSGRLGPPGNERIVVKHAGRIIFLNVPEIDWVEASGNYVKFHIGKETHLIRMTLHRALEKLERTRFLQIHRSIIVNVSRIKELIRCNVNEFIVVLQDGKQLPSGRRYAASLKALFRDRL